MSRSEFLNTLVRQGWSLREAQIEWSRLTKEVWVVIEPGVERRGGPLPRLRNTRS